ncbi:hypothetical protein GS429_16800 [Natronorubrum sp. JWXQ-INN-674]|uniref:Uncharacterized protein n=1 Tax=Natronorubrum halalkaliphilum TaxID=2691917 RepID=A0A6B0VQB1_9EURY|nr:hypothetical protein [Natronorubrum halalkaliphilum]MXV63688.1 hypothetical protein [Natronorubrum halalkaliphilum]
MTRDRPTPPAGLDRESAELLAMLEDRDAETLRAVGGYLEELAAWKASRAGDGREHEQSEVSDTGTETATGTDTNPEPTADDNDVDNTEEADLEYPDDVPERASVTVKEIGGTTYHYYQWRDGDRIESKTIRR